MTHFRCKHCNIIINDKMDIHYLGYNCEFFCSEECIIEYCKKEYDIKKVSVKNIRETCDIALFKNGELYQSNIEDDSCYDCEDGIYLFLKMIKENNIDYEIYKCNKCGKEIKIYCD